MSNKANSVLGEAAYLEDFNEESQAVLPGTKQAANSAAKRSKPDLTVTKLVRDEFSDSGYSSHTAATLGSAHSSLESKTETQSLEANAASKRKPPKSDKQPLSRRQSPEKPPLQRTTSKPQKKPEAISAPCNCSERISYVRRSAAPLQASHHHAGNPKARPKPSAPAPPQTARHAPPQAHQDVPILQPAQPRPRAARPGSYRARPMSFHGTIPEAAYMQQPIYIQPSPSPRYSAAPSFPPSSFPPPQHSYFPPPQTGPQPQEFYAAIPPYEIQPSRPRPQRWSTVQAHPPSRPQSMIYPASSPIIEYGHEPIYTTIAPTIRPPSRQPSLRERPMPVPVEVHAHEEDYKRMLPPPPPPTKERTTQRPVVKKSATTSDARPAIHHRGAHESVAANVGKRSPTKQTFSEHAYSRRPSITHSTRTSDETIPSTHPIEHGLRRMSIDSDSSKNRRRASVYGHESLADLEESVEGYIGAQGAGPKNNIPIESLVRTKKTHSNSKSSHTSSRKSDKSGKSKRSSKSGSDIKSRRPGSDVKTRKESDALAMRFNASQGVNVEFKGNSAEGRKINLRQSRDGDGEMELNISARGRDSANSRPAVRAKSTRRYSHVDGEGTKELERTRTTSRPPAPKEVPKRAEPKYEPRTIRERITTRIRRSSRSVYQGE